jgi:7-cyano-7-deazaguanine synthase
MRGYEFLGRNALFVLAAGSLGPPPLRVSLAINRGPEYYDISPRFLIDCQRMLDGYFGGTVVLEAPFVDYSKKDIIRYCKRRKVPLNITYSCQKKNSPPCGRCPTCLDRERYLGEKWKL